MEDNQGERERFFILKRNNFVDFIKKIIDEQSSSGNTFVTGRAALWLPSALRAILSFVGPGQDLPFKWKYTPPISLVFLGFSCPPLAHCKPIANNQRLKDFIEVQWH